MPSGGDIMEVKELLEELRIKEAQLKLLDYGSVEIREKNNNKYIYTHYKLLVNTLRMSIIKRLIVI